MVGSGTGGPQLPNESGEPDKPTGKPRVKSFSCTACGASVTLRYPGASMSVVCDSCHSVIDVTDENYTILTKYYAKTGAYKPIIPLGTRGKLKDRTWEVIGYIVRSDVKSSYSWEEFLLFNPYYGYRWLVQDHGHWNFVRTIKEKPDEIAGTSWAQLGEKRYKVFNRGQAEVTYVLGEFYWRVVVGSRVYATDYICPPEMLSYEKDDNEVVWSIAEYVQARVIADAFKITIPMQYAIGVGPNQPAPITQSWQTIKLWWMVFLAVLTCAQIALAGMCLNATAFQSNYPFTPNTKATDLTTQVFTLEKGSANVKIVFEAPVDNSWFYVGGELVNDTDGTSYPFEQTVEFYSGSDSDGYWSEGAKSSSLLISAVPAGKYYLNLDTESGDYKDLTPNSFTLTVQRDVTMYANYFLCLFFVSVMPAFVWMMSRQTEVSRWSNSDFSPYPSIPTVSSSSS